MQCLKCEMITSTYSSVTACAWVLLSLFPAVIAGQTLNVTSVVHRGNAVNISCNYKSLNDTEGVTVKLENSVKLCSVRNNNNSWINHSCKDRYRFVWIPEMKKMLFEILNLQINDSGIYKCVVSRLIPPPTVCLGEKRTSVQVIAKPSVSVSHGRSSGGFPMILCISEGFYPSAIEQLWMRNGEFLNVSLTHNINTTNPDGSFTLHSYLNTSDCENHSCWVNHSSLSRPATLHLTPDECHETTTGVIMVVVISSLLIVIILIITVVCERFRRAHHRSPVSVNTNPDTDLQVHLQSEIYSTLGSHHPVPCSPVGVHPSAQYTPNRNNI